MSARLRNIATENERIVREGRYRTTANEVEVGDALAQSIAGTTLYQPGEFAGYPESRGNTTSVEVRAEDSISAAVRLAHRSNGFRIGVLNFASARNPGGGYVNGAKAQEEDVCRRTLLYPCLLAAPEFYTAHRARRDLRYSDRLIYAPQVPVIRDKTYALEPEPARIDVFTCAAPNATALARENPSAAGNLAGVLAERTRAVLGAAARHDARMLVLGAWGCGVFGNDPAQVAEAFRIHLRGEFKHAFALVVFAVPDRGEDGSVRRTFQAAFPTHL